MRTLLSRLVLGLAVVSPAACVQKTEVPSLTGPSSLALTVRVSASPDRIAHDGASGSTIIIETIGPDGRPLPNQDIRVDMTIPCAATGQQTGCVNGQVLQDFGTLSSRTPRTGSDGVARITYTAPPAPSPILGGTTTPVTIVATPIMSNGAPPSTSQVTITLVPQGVILPPAETPVARFVVSPSPVALAVPTTFDASTSCAVPLVNNLCPQTATSVITSYFWNFGDGGTATGRVVTHTYTTTGTFNGTLTVTNDRGVSASAPITITLAGTPGDTITGDWFISPINPVATQPTIFNATTVQAAPGHTITSHVWNFGDGSTDQPTSGVIVTHTFAVAGTYNVQLTVTDDLGRSKVFPPRAITVTAGNPIATFTSTVTNPATHTVTFDASASTAAGGATIVSYQWAFGDAQFSPADPSPTVSHSYAAAGTYTVRVTVTDSAGRQGTFSTSVTVP